MASPSEALAPLGVSPPTRATLAAATERQPAARSHRLWATLDARGQAVAPGHGCRGQHRLLSVDRTTIALGLPLVPWARVRTAKGALTGPTLLDHAGHLPAVGGMTDGQGRAIAMARGLQRPPGNRGAMDRGASADRFPWRLTPRRRRRCPPPARHGHVAGDRALGGALAARRDLRPARRPARDEQPAPPHALKRVGARAPETGHHAVFWTTALQVAAATHAALETARWPLERCFKTRTPQLQSKTFLGTSEQAVMTHLWIALITDLMGAILRVNSGLGLACQPRLRRLHITLVD